MSLTVKHLNSDTSFLLTFEPTSASPPSTPTPASNAFTIVLDPWLVGPSKIFHSRFSSTRHTDPPCISDLSELPEPDLVIISQSKSDHCHRETLTQLPASGGKTIILAEPGAAKVIRGWKYFDAKKVLTLPRWDETKPSNIHRRPIGASHSQGMQGEVTIALLSQKPDLTGLHSAIGITYRSPTVPEPPFPPSLLHLQLPDTPPHTPKSFTSSISRATTLNQQSNQALSLLYSPHGIPYKCLQPYISTHLVSVAALPLTALLHSFNVVQNVWYLGGNICSGFPGGLEIAQNLTPKVWISAHDGDKEIKGIANGKIEISKFGREDVEAVVSPRSEKFPNRKIGTEAVILGVGEEIRLSNEMQFGRDSSSIDERISDKFGFSPVFSTKRMEEKHEFLAPPPRTDIHHNGVRPKRSLVNMASLFRSSSRPDLKDDGVNVHVNEKRGLRPKRSFVDLAGLRRKESSAYTEL